MFHFDLLIGVVGLAGLCHHHPSAIVMFVIAEASYISLCKGHCMGIAMQNMQIN